MKKERKEKISFMLNNLVKAGIITDWRSGGAGTWFVYYDRKGVQMVDAVKYFTYEQFTKHIDDIVQEVMNSRKELY